MDMTSDQDLGKLIQELVTRVVQEQWQMAQRYGEALQHLSPDDLAQPAVREAYARLAREEAARFARSAAVLSLSYTNSLMELARASGERLIEQIAQTPESRTAGSPRRRVPVELRAPVGQLATASFAVANRRAERVQVSFLASDFTSEGVVPFRAPLQFQPPRLELEPRQERVVKLQLHLAPELFAAGKDYAATVALGGYQDMELALHVSPQSPASPRPAARSKSTRVRASKSAAARTRSARKSPQRPAPGRPRPGAK